jgi:hypothetical protein
VVEFSSVEYTTDTKSSRLTWIPGERHDSCWNYPLSRGTPPVWTAIDPKTKLLLNAQEGDRTLGMAQAMLHQIVQLLAPGCVPLFLSDGNPNYLPAIVTHLGHWVPLPRRRGRWSSPGSVIRLHG